MLNGTPHTQTRVPAPQDAGLIFLSAMATSIVSDLKHNNCSDDEIIATTVVMLAASTTLLGVAIFATGKLKLAGLVQYVKICP